MENQQPVSKQSDTSKILRRASLTYQVIESIREAILKGEFKTGEHIMEGELSRRFRVSNSVVREAFAALEGEGILTSTPHRGRVVCEIEEEESQKLLGILAYLEGQVAYWVTKELRPADRKEIDEAARSMRSNPPTGYLEWIRWELAFHQKLWQSARVSWLERQASQLTTLLLAQGTAPNARLCDRPQALRRIPKTITVWEQQETSHSHRHLANVILDGDPNKARNTATRHVIETFVLIWDHS